MPRIPPPLPPCQETMNNLKTGTKLALMPSPQLSPHPCVTSSQGRLATLRESGSGGRQGALRARGRRQSRASLPVCADHTPLPWDPSPRRALPGGPWSQQVTLRQEEPCEQVTPLPIPVSPPEQVQVHSFHTGSKSAIPRERPLT